MRSSVYLKLLEGFSSSMMLDVLALFLLLKYSMHADFCYNMQIDVEFCYWKTCADTKILIMLLSLRIIM